MSDIVMTIEQQIAFAERDLAMRRAAYPKMVEAQQISADRAAGDLDTLTAIVGTLRMLQATALAAGPKGRRPKPPKIDRRRGLPVVLYFDTPEARSEFLTNYAEAARLGNRMVVPNVETEQ